MMACSCSINFRMQIAFPYFRFPSLSGASKTMAHNLLTQALNRTATAAPATATQGSLALDFETRARLKAHRIPVYKAEPDLEVMIRFVKAVEHHVRLGGGSGDGLDARHRSIAWTHLHNLLAYPWFVTWIGKAPCFISETSIATSLFGKCTWEAFTVAFRAQFGAQHAMQKVRQQLRDLKYNKADVAAFNRRFLELATMLDLPSSSPYTSGLSCQTPALPATEPGLSSLGVKLSRTNHHPRQRHPAGCSIRSPGHITRPLNIGARPGPQLSGPLPGPHPHSPCPHSGPPSQCHGPEPHAGRSKCNGPRAAWPT